MSLQNLLSLNFLVPFVAAKNDFSRAIRGLRGMPRRLLLVGHKLTAGALAVNTIATVSTEADAVAQFGEGSQLVAMWRAAKANADLGLPIDAIAISPGGSAVAATSTLALTNAAGAGAQLTASGEVALYIEGVRVSVGVTTADTQATAATKLRNAINAIPSLPVAATATANTNEVLLTCRWGGTTGNDIDLRNAYYLDDRMPAGLTMTLPAMASGAVSPDGDARDRRHDRLPRHRDRLRLHRQHQPRASGSRDGHPLDAQQHAGRAPSAWACAAPRARSPAGSARATARTCTQ